MKKGTIDQLRTSVNSFIISEDSTKNYNQIKGRHMIAHFNGKSIKDVDVNGNGESIYFVAEEENTEALMGMNQIIRSNMKIIFTGAKTNNEETFNSLIDGELISHDKEGKFINLYAAFDIYYKNKIDLRKHPFMPNLEKEKEKSRSKKDEKDPSSSFVISHTLSSLTGANLWKQMKKAKYSWSQFKSSPEYKDMERKQFFRTANAMRVPDAKYPGDQ